MPSNRFNMTFHNGNTLQSLRQLNYGQNMAAAPKVIAPVASSALTSPMVGRIHKAKPGCSACGKKVA